VRGYGYSHDGSLDTMFRFQLAPPFTPNPLLPGGPIPADAAGLQARRNMEAFMFAFDSNLKPIVGQQVTVRRENLASATARADLLLARANAGDSDLIVKANVAGREVGFSYAGGGKFTPDRAKLPQVTYAQLRTLANATDLTFSSVPPGSGRRLGIDRDNDGTLDGDELDRGTDPENPR
jgi:hypothetical protein